MLAEVRSLAWELDPIFLYSSSNNREKRVTLRPYQMDALAAFELSREKEEKRGIIVLPTGGGKTVIFGSIEEPDLFSFSTKKIDPYTQRKGKWRMLILAHRDTLCQQAYDSMAKMHPYFSIGLEKAKNSCRPTDDIVIASVQTLGIRSKNEQTGEHETSKRLLRFKPDDFDVVVIDECHHAVSNSYLRILQHLKAGTPEGPYLLGVTATPDRGDGKSLNDLFLGNLLFCKEIKNLQQEGYLCPALTRRVYTDVDISDVPVRGEDFDERKLSEKLNIDYRNSFIISAIQDHAHTRECVLIFAVDVAHAEKLSKDMQSKGMNAECIHYKKTKEEKHKILNDFQEGKLRYLVNVAMLTEGFDNPKIDCLVLARPTRSPLLMTQILGRGLRQLCTGCGSTSFEVEDENIVCNICSLRKKLKEGKNCLILDVVDVLGGIEIQSPHEIFGVPDMDILEMPLHEAAEIVQQAQELGVQIRPDDNIEQVQRIVEVLGDLARGIVEIDTMAEAIDIFNATRIEEEQRASRFPWLQMGRDKYLLYPLASRDQENPRMGLWRDAFGIWWMAKGREKVQLSESDATPWKKIDRQVKKWLGRKVPVNDNYSVPEWRFISLDAKWRQKKATPNLIYSLKRMGIKEIPPNITRGEASDKIQWLKSQKKKLGLSQ